MVKTVSGKKGMVKTAKKPAAAARKPATATRKKSGSGKKAVARKASSTAKKSVKTVAGKKGKGDMTRYRCRLCGYIYSPLRGEPHNGIPAGTPFEDLPEDYVCPVCGQQGRGRIGKWGFEEWRPTKWICSMCDYVYDEKRGEPHRGIKPGTKFEDLPDDYVCPVCALDPKIRIEFGKVLKQGFGPLYI